MQTLGYSIALDVYNQDESRAWSAMSIAVAWYEASGQTPPTEESTGTSNGFASNK
jgi:hypothetical protein